jgi:hypothetical protein
MLELIIVIDILLLSTHMLGFLDLALHYQLRIILKLEEGRPLFGALSS